MGKAHAVRFANESRGTRNQKLETPKEAPMLDDTVIIALVPGCVEVARRSGLPTRFAPVAAIGFALTLVALSHLAAAGDPISMTLAARLLLTGLIDGLAAIGLYRLIPRSPANDTVVIPSDQGR
jgi:hypothetical protein